MAVRRANDKAYDLACESLRRESPVVPPAEVIEARAAEYRGYLTAAAERGEAIEALDLKAVEATVKRKTKPKGNGIPRPNEVLRGKARHSA